MLPRNNIQLRLVYPPSLSLPVTKAITRKQYPFSQANQQPLRPLVNNVLRNGGFFNVYVCMYVVCSSVVLFILPNMTSMAAKGFR